MSKRNVMAEMDVAIGMEQLFQLAVEGNFEALQGSMLARPLEMVTPVHEDTILHIHITVKSGKSSVDFVRKVLEMCNTLRWKTNSEDETLLHLAARYGDKDIVRVLLMETNPGDEETAMKQEAATGLLMETKSGDTALHEAARYNHPQVVKILIEANPNHSYGRNRNDKTPLYLAAEMGSRNAVSQLLESCASPKYEGPDRKTALHVAVLRNDIEITKMLLTRKLPDLTRIGDKSGWVPLHYAAEEGFLRIVLLLVNKDPLAACIRDESGMTALHVAAKNRRANVMRKIMSKCPSCCELEDNDGNNLLHFVMEGNSKRALNVALCNPFVRFNLVNRKNNIINNDIRRVRPLDQLPNTFDLHPFTDDPRQSFAFVLKRGFLIFCNILFCDIIDRDLEVKKYQREDIDNSEDGEDNIIAVKVEVEGEGEGGGTGRERISRDDDSSKNYRDELQIYLVVATLVATVTFAAAMTMPGGFVADKGSDQGSPVLMKSRAFQVFLVVDISSLIASVIAVFIPIFMVQFMKRSQRAALNVASMATLWALTYMVIAFCAGTYAVVSRSDKSNAASYFYATPVLASIFLIAFLRFRSG